MTLPSVAGAGTPGAAKMAPIGKANFVTGGSKKTVPQENAENSQRKINASGDKVGEQAPKKRILGSRLDQMKSFLSSFNKQQDKTRKLLTEINTPVRERESNAKSAFSSASASSAVSTPASSTTTSGSAKDANASTDLGSAVNKKQAQSTPSKSVMDVRRNTFGTTRTNYLRQKIKDSALLSTSSPSKIKMKKDQTISDFLASDAHYENSSGRVSPSQASWLEGLRRMREKRTSGRKTIRYNQGGDWPHQTPTSINELCEEEIEKKERTRLARRLSTLSFPMKACLAALEESDGDIEKSVALLLRWYPKGSGSRGAVHNLVKIILGAEKKLQSLRAKLQILYAPNLPSSSEPGGANPAHDPSDPTPAVRAIFDRYDTDGSGTIEHSEFRHMLKDLGVEMTHAEFQEAVTMLDSDHNGKIDFEEFLLWWKQNAGNGVVLSADIDSLFKHVLQEAKSTVNADKASLLLVDRAKEQLWSRVADADITIRMPYHKGIAGHVVRTGEVLNVPDAHCDPRFNPEFDRKTGYVTKQLMALPILAKKDEYGERPESRDSHDGNTRRRDPKNPAEQDDEMVVGVVEVINSHNDRAFTDADQMKLVELCDRIRHGVVNVARMMSAKQNESKDKTKNEKMKHLGRNQRSSGKLGRFGSQNTPLLLPLSPQRSLKKRPNSSPTQRSRKSVYGSMPGQQRRHTYNITDTYQYQSASTNKLILAPDMRFADASVLPQDQRHSYMQYKQSQMNTRNQNRVNPVNKIASMLATYDKVHGIKQKSPKRTARKSISQGNLAGVHAARAEEKRRQHQRWYQKLNRNGTGKLPGL